MRNLLSAVFVNEDLTKQDQAIQRDLRTVVAKAKLLGKIIIDDLKWNRNTAVIVKKAYGRM